MAGRRPSANRSRICCFNCSAESKDVVMTTGPWLARIPRPRSSGCGRGTCQGHHRRLARTESRTLARPWSRDVHKPSIRLRHRDRPRCDQVCDSVACRSGSLRGLVRIGELRLAWLARASGLRGRIRSQIPRGVTPRYVSHRPGGRHPIRTTNGAARLVVKIKDVLTDRSWKRR